MDAPKVSNIFLYIVKVVMQRSLIFASIGGASIVVVTVLLLFSVFAISTKDYAIDIDPIKDNHNLFILQEEHSQIRIFACNKYCG